MQRQSVARFMSKDGKEIPTGERVQPVKLLIQLPQTVVDRVLDLAVECGMTPSEFVVAMLETHHGIEQEERA